MANFSNKGFEPTTKSIEVVKIHDDGSYTIKVSAAALGQLLLALQTAAPIIKGQSAGRELKQINRLLEKAQEAEREIKAVQMKAALDPDLTRLALLKRGL